MSDSNCKAVLVGTIEPVFFRRDMEKRDLRMMAQGRNFRVMTKKGWAYTFGSHTAQLVAKMELDNA